MKLEKLFDVLGEILAFVTAVVWVLVIINQNFNFLPTQVADILTVSKSWLLLALVGVVGFEATVKRNIIIRLIFYVLLAVLIIFHCFPGTYDYLVGLIK
jgi:hypothetical protein